ncbi:hypothetical protein ORJ00_01345 [Rheinheimera baltica]|uniref:hypothetical protein n=1 Tax=Rheinheimera baltica TaxID=67576 RepID=UPI00273DF767|nr:hypothetical protein [Rheinheimera baltica]MDP5141383.1 hypothetical protein [Rheinheimera baltica]
MKREKAFEILNIMEDETTFSLSNFIPSYAVLKVFLQQHIAENALEAKLSFPFDEQLYREVTDLLVAGEIGRRFEQVAVPAYVDTPLKWEAWVCNKKYAVPYEEYLKLIETENDALLKLNAALDGAEDEVSALNLAYLDSAQQSADFFNKYSKS